MSLLATTETFQTNKPLEEAFLAFNQISQHLTDSYQQLEKRVVTLSDELARTHSERIRHLSEKETLAKQLEGLIEVMPGALIVLDEQQQIIKANACARTWLADDIVGLNWQAVSEDRLTSDELLSNQCTLKNGRVVTVSKTTLMGESGDVVLLSDITQQQILQQQLEHKKKLAEMGEFSASLAHQIRTPLASALLYASQLNSDALPEESREKFSNKLLERLRMLNSLVTDMLRYSRSGQFIKAPVNISGFIDRLSRLYQEKTVSFETNSISSITVDISEEALAGAVSNLIDNALDAIGYDASVECVIELSNNNELIIKVKDEGVGLTLEQQNRIFEPFYSSKANGTGLGLAVVNEVVSAHKGSVECQSKIGVGTTMVLTLPVVISASKNMNRE
ncbi:MAG: GHKL domain-containing protein [Cycloclasticus sp.]|nr:GHKL domain-containing protein [Cycloclasticus sp.]